MFRHRYRRMTSGGGPAPTLALALALVAALVAGCSRKSGSNAETAAGASETTTSAAAPANAPASAVRVSEIQLGSTIGQDKHVTHATDTFRPTETIYATVATTGSAPTAEIRTVWTYGNGQRVHEETRAIAPNGPAVTEFHIAKPSGWPTGTYQVAVFLDGQPAGTKAFTVKK